MTKKQIIIGLVVLAAAVAIYFFFFKKKDNKTDSASQKKVMLDKIHSAGWVSFDTSNFPPEGTKIPPFEDYNTAGIGFKYDGYTWETAGTEEEIQLIFKG